MVKEYVDLTQIGQSLELKKLQDEISGHVERSQMIPNSMSGKLAPLDLHALFMSFKNPNTLDKWTAILYQATSYLSHLRIAKSDILSEIYISTNNYHLYRILHMFGLRGNRENAAHLIKLLKSMNIIRLYKNKYRWVEENSTYNKCYSYLYDYDNEQIFRKYVKESGILEKFSYINERKFIESEIRDLIDESKIRIGSALFLHKVYNMSMADFEDLVRDAIYDKYPMIKDAQEKIQDMNNNYYSHDGFKFNFEIHFTWNKGKYPNRWISKISIRVSNPFSSLPKTMSLKKFIENPTKILEFESRDEVLRSFKLNTHYDVNGSVPRLTYSINNGYWLNDAEDIYSKFLNKFEENLTTKYSNLAKVENFSREDVIEYINKLTLSEDNKLSKINEIFSKYETIDRATLKNLFMYVYFDLTSEKSLVAHLNHKLAKPISKYPKVSAIGNTILMYKDAVKDIIGNSFGSEIFLHESCIYLDVTYKLLKAGYNCLLVYDSWYVDSLGKSAVEMQQIIESFIEESFNEYTYKYYNYIYR